MVESSSGQAYSPSESANVRLLLVAVSARALAQSASRAGLRPAVIDWFGDEDTRASASACITLAGFEAAQWLAAADRILPADVEVALIYGGGLDSHPDLLEQLARGRTLLGNTPAVARLVHDARAFFALLDRLAIPYPESRFSSPETPDGWLIKSGCGEGGVGVRLPANSGPDGDDEYYQRRLPGPACSLLFLANGRDIVPVGFNTLWTSAHAPLQPCLFGGAINRAELTLAQRAAVEDYATRLTRALGLIGLNSLDFMRDGEDCRVLEINPRPSATLGLYDADYCAGLVQAHIDACRGSLIRPDVSQGPVRAFRIVYLARAIALGSADRLPDWCADRPPAGARLASGEPLCSIQVEGPDEAQVLNLMAVREAALRSLLTI